MSGHLTPGPVSYKPVVAQAGGPLAHGPAGGIPEPSFTPTYV